MADTKIELLECQHCGRLAFSVNDTRQATYETGGANSQRKYRGHGSGKCAGVWTVVLTSDRESFKERK